MEDFEYYHSDSQKRIIMVFDRINGIKGYCFTLSCSCDCGDSCDFEQNERIKDRFPDAYELQKHEVIEIMQNHNCEHGIKILGLIKG